MSGLGEIALIRGLNYLSESQAAIAHNLANVSSFGFKRRISVAEPIGQSFNEVLEGRYPTTRYTEFLDLTLGTPNPTGNSNHIAIQGKQFLKVQADDGRKFFTRNGQLLITAKRQLVISTGHRLLNDEGQPITVQGAELAGAALGQMKISPAGVITINNKAGVEDVVARIQVYEVPDPQLLRAAGNGLLSYPGINNVRAQPTNNIVQGALEQSNVQPTKELIDMIVAQRGFQASMRALTTLGRIKETFITGLSR